MLTDDPSEQREIRYIIANKLKHSFYIANITMLALFGIWKVKVTEIYGVNTSVALLATCIYEYLI